LHLSEASTPYPVMGREKNCGVFIILAATQKSSHTSKRDTHTHMDFSQQIIPPPSSTSMDNVYTFTKHVLYYLKGNTYQAKPKWLGVWDLKTYGN